MNPAAYQAFEHAGWQRAAAAYAVTFDAATQHYTAALLDAAGVGDGTEVLDVACGIGTLAAAASSRGAQVVGIDFSLAMLAQARARYPGLAFREGDAQALPFDEPHYDAVTINFGVHHFPQPQRALAEARRVLRPGGRLAFTVWAAPDVHALHGIAIEAVQALGDAGAALPAPPQGDVNRAETCLRLLGEAGFDAVHCDARTLPATLCLPGVAELMLLMREGTVRLAALIATQSAERGAALLADIERRASRFEREGRLEIPMAAILASAVKS